MKMGKMRDKAKMQGCRRGMRGENGRKIKWCALFLAMMVFVGALQTQAASAKVSCKALCGAALKASGGSEYLKYKSEDAADFGGFSVTDRKKVSSVMYLCDNKEVYSICVAEAKNKKDASSLYKTLKRYKTNNNQSDYLGDYSASEQKVFQSAICGKSKNYVWYIALSSNGANNKKGQSAMKKKIS